MRSGDVQLHSLKVGAVMSFWHARRGRWGLRHFLLVGGLFAQDHLQSIQPLRGAHCFLIVVQEGATGPAGGGLIDLRENLREEPGESIQLLVFSDVHPEIHHDD